MKATDDKTVPLLERKLLC